MEEITGTNIEEALFAAIDFLLDVPNPDVEASGEVGLHDVVICAETCRYDVDLGRDFWMRPGHWTKLTRKYMSWEALHTFRDRCDELLDSKRPGSTVMLFNDKEPEPEQGKYKWGNCLISLTLRTNPPEFVLVSRTSYLAWTGLLDAMIVPVFIRDVLNYGTMNFGFSWYIQTAKLHAVNTLFYAMTRYPKVLAKAGREADSPGWSMLGKLYDSLIRTNEASRSDVLKPSSRLRFAKKLEMIRNNVKPKYVSMTSQNLEFDL